MRRGSPRPAFGARPDRLDGGSLATMAFLGVADWAVRIGRSVDGACIFCLGIGVLLSRFPLEPVRDTGLSCARCCFDDDLWNGESPRRSWRDAAAGARLLATALPLAAVARLDDDATRRGGLAGARPSVDIACPDWDAALLTSVCKSEDEFVGRNDVDVTVRRWSSPEPPLSSMLLALLQAARLLDDLVANDFVERIQKHDRQALQAVFYL